MTGKILVGAIAFFFALGVVAHMTGHPAAGPALAAIWVSLIGVALVRKIFLWLSR